jgi:hypothetical protein
MIHGVTIAGHLELPREYRLFNVSCSTKTCQVDSFIVFSTVKNSLIESLHIVLLQKSNPLSLTDQLYSYS